MMQPIENWKCDNTRMKYETVKSLKDADFKRSTGVSRRVFDQMLQVIEKGLSSFGRPPNPRMLITLIEVGLSSIALL